MAKSKSQLKRLAVQRGGTMSDPLKPSLSLLCKLGSIVVHADEALSPGGHHFDVATIRTLLADQEVNEWLKTMTVYLPAKRN